MAYYYRECMVTAQMNPVVFGGVDTIGNLFFSIVVHRT